jgi:xylulokinase
VRCCRQRAAAPIFLPYLSGERSLESVCASPPVRDRFDPEAQLADMLAARHARFRRLYPALRAHFER